MTTPPIGLTSKAVVTNIVDGDTIDVEVRRTIRIRLLDCWAPEVRGPEKPKGLKAEAHLSTLLNACGRKVIIHIPASVDGEIQDAITMGRLLGHVWPEDGGDSLSIQMVRDGFACKVKPTK